MTTFDQVIKLLQHQPTRKWFNESFTAPNYSSYTPEEPFEVSITGMVGNTLRVYSMHISPPRISGSVEGCKVDIYSLDQGRAEISVPVDQLEMFLRDAQIVDSGSGVEFKWRP